MESGRRSDRPELAKALAHCRVMGATLIVAQRISADPQSGFYDEAGRGWRGGAVLRPAANRRSRRKIHATQMLAMAELEAGLISDRTRKALAAAKARGQKLGSPQNLRNQDLGGANGRATRTRIAQGRAADLSPIVAEIKIAGASSLRQIAAGMTSAGFRQCVAVHGQRRRSDGCWCEPRTNPVIKPSTLRYYGRQRKGIVTTKARREPGREEGSAAHLQVNAPTLPHLQSDAALQPYPTYRGVAPCSVLVLENLSQQLPSGVFF